MSRMRSEARAGAAQWRAGAPCLATWDSAKDKRDLYDITKDFSEAADLAAKDPKRLARLQKTFDAQARANHVGPLGAGIWLRLHPGDRIGAFIWAKMVYKF